METISKVKLDRPLARSDKTTHYDSGGRLHEESAQIGESVSGVLPESPISSPETYREGGTWASRFRIKIMATTDRLP